MKFACNNINNLTRNAKLRPMTCVINGAPKQDANAISGFPFLATTVSATQSATEFPTANTVRPRIAARINKWTKLITV